MALTRLLALFHPRPSLSERLTEMRAARDAFFAAVPVDAPWDLTWPERLATYVEELEQTIVWITTRPGFGVDTVAEIRQLLGRHAVVTLERLALLDVSTAVATRTLMTSNVGALCQRLVALGERESPASMANALARPADTVPRRPR
jgi:hypothetical protein